MNMNVEGWRGSGRPKKRLIDCVKQDMREMAVCDEMTSDRGEWKEKRRLLLSPSRGDVSW
jgi:hypothetical protein